MLRVLLTRRSGTGAAEDGMIPVCCEAFEAALSLGMLIRAPNVPGIVYIRSDKRLWAIQHCPHCGSLLELEPSDAPLDVEQLTNETVLPPVPKKKPRSCALCTSPDHDARNCDMLKK